MLQVVLVAAAVVFVAGSIGIWSRIVTRWLHKQPPIERESHGAVPWGFLDILLAIALLFTFSVAATAVVNRHFDVTAQTPRADLSLPYHCWNIAGLTLASLATLIMTTAAQMFRYGATLSELGMGLGNAGRDVRLGVVAFLALAPPTYALQLLLVQWVESKHPLVELLRQHHDPRLVAASIGSAVIVAPVFEEFLFRGLIQGWLEKLVSDVGDPMQLFLGGSGVAQETGAVVPADDQGPTDATKSDADAPAWYLSYFPILVTSALFAVLHMAHGPDAVPLFFLALGLGYLYQQTHRLLPCITVHFLLNASSMGMFLTELF